jgi:hypothetical protein
MVSIGSKVMAYEFFDHRFDGRADIFWDIGGGEPIPFGVLVVQADLAAGEVRAIDNGHIINFVAVGINVEQVRTGEHAKQGLVAEFQSRLFPDLAPGRVFDDFAQLHRASRRTPAAAVGPFHQQETVVFIGDKHRRADHEERRVSDVLA